MEGEVANKRPGRPRERGVSVYTRLPRQIVTEIRRRATAGGVPMSTVIRQILAASIQGGK